MTTGDTIGRVSRPRGELTTEQFAMEQVLREDMETARDVYRGFVVNLLRDGRSFNEVSKATGLSKDTLQRWKREAGK